MENKKESIWKPVFMFYGKTTSWIVVPLVVGLLAGKYLAPSLFTILILISFGVTCFGIYREVKNYKKTLNPPKDGQE